MIANALPTAAKPSPTTRWIAYTGAPVLTVIPGLNLGEPVDLIIDLATLTVDGPVVPALRDHATPVGTWSDISIDRTRGVIGTLNLLEASNEARGLAMFDGARELRLSIEAGIPWQASIAAKPGPSGSYDPVMEPININGQTIAPSPDGIPCFALRGGILTEISILLWGADSQTHQLPAALAEPTQDDICRAMASVRDYRGRPMRGFAAHTAAIALLAANRATASRPRPRPAGRPRNLVEAMLSATGPNGAKLSGFAALRQAQALFPDLH